MEPPKANMTPKGFDFKLKEKDIIFTITFSEENERNSSEKKKKYGNDFSEKSKSQDISLTPSGESSYLGISISEDGSVPPVSYSAKYTLTELNKLSRYFLLFGSIEELISELQILCSENQVKISKKKELINLILALPLKIVHEVYLPIPLDKADPKKVIVSLCQTVNELNKKIKTLMVGEIPEEQLEENLNSKDILKNEDEKNMVINWILQAMKSKDKKVNMTILYRLKSDGDSASTFHSKCNNQGPTLTLVRNTRGYRCGGFTNQSWSGRYNPSYGGSASVNDPNAFLFSLDFKEKYPTYDGQNAIYDCTSYGPCFGSNTDLYIADSCSRNNSSYCNFPYYYCGTRARALSGGSYNFKVDELEVYKIDFL